MKRLSQEEQAERRRLGLCYNCDEKYSRGNNRVCRRIFYIDGVTLTDAEDAALDADQDGEAPVFSLQAVAGVPICDTMQIRVMLGAVTLTALLDTSSTHNFIAEEAAATNSPSSLAAHGHKGNGRRSRFGVRQRRSPSMERSSTWTSSSCRWRDTISFWEPNGWLPWGR